MTGGSGGYGTTEILEDKKWQVLPNGNLPGNAHIYGLKLATVSNQVFSFGKFKTYFIHLLNNFLRWLWS